jgi:galactose mutarotase-like enzyme
MSTASARVATWHGVAAAVLTTGDTEVVVVPELGMLVAAFVVDGFDHVARPGGPAAVRAGHTTAVPLLYPWANRLSRRSYTAAGHTVSLRGLALHSDGNGLPIHGTFIGRPGWTVGALGRGRIDARHEITPSSAGFDAFPFPHALAVSVRVGRRRVRVDTVVEATAGVAVPVSFGWHPYWRLPGPRDDWAVRLPDVAHARLDRRGLPTGRARVEPAADRPLHGQDLDDLYAFAGDRTATLHGGGRSLRLALDTGYPFVQVYAPDTHAFCCVEPMTAPTNALVTGDHPTVRPGARFAASFTATVGLRS